MASYGYGLCVVRVIRKACPAPSISLRFLYPDWPNQTGGRYGCTPDIYILVGTTDEGVQQFGPNMVVRMKRPTSFSCVSWVLFAMVLRKNVCVVFTLSRSFYPMPSVHPVSVLILYPREIQIMTSQTVRQRKPKTTATYEGKAIKILTCCVRVVW